MHRFYFYLILSLAAASVALVSYSMWKEAHSPVPTFEKTLALRPVAPFKSYISAVGVVEPSSENVMIGIPVNRIVEAIEVKVGEKVKKGHVLFRLECRDLAADLLMRNLAYANAQAEVKKLESLPRAEDLASAEAALKIGQLALDESRSHYQNVEGLQVSRAMSQEEINRRHVVYEQAEARVQELQAALDKVKAGVWQPDLEIARLQAKQAQANIQRVEADIARTIVRAPIDATVLQIKIHEGEFPPADTSRVPPMIIGNIDAMHVRVSINQFDASYFDPKASAVAYLQGNAKIGFPLNFVQIEPFFVNKQNLTNDISEKVDTRVLQVIYCFNEQDHRIFVGQQMDVFIETDYSPFASVETKPSQEGVVE